MDVKKFKKDVDFYKKQINFKTNVLIKISLNNEAAYYSLAAFTKALHDKNIDVNVAISKSEDNLRLEDLYKAFSDKKNPKHKVLLDFINAVDEPKFKKIFKSPLVITANKKGFLLDGRVIPFRYGWLKKRKYKEIVKTSRNVLKNVFNLRKNERLGISFTLIQSKAKAPLQDLLDNFLIARATYDAAKKFTKHISMGSSTQRDSVLADPEPVSELKATIMGCEYEKAINEPIFKLFQKVSKEFNFVLKPNSALFGVYGEGYPGKHYFGQKIGYPTLNRKSRWSSPGQMFFKFSWYPQSSHEERDPLSRVGFTSTIPIEDYIRTCDIDWIAMAKRNRKIAEIMKKSNKMHVESDKTNFVVDLKGRRPMVSDIDIKDKYDKEHYKDTGVKTGTMANLPGGEAFITPESLKGKIVGDVVISIDDSYTLSAKNPLIIEAYGNKYKVISGPTKVLKKIKDKKKEAWKKIMYEEKAKSLPKEIINLKKRNFERIGEFAINTHPTAKLSRYLIINEKISNMIHVALGSGFEADRNTEYHWDIVIDAKKQKLDIYGVNGKKKFYVLKKGKFVI